MLPKVATHFLHTTSRAAAQAVQNPLRNVLQSGSSNSNHHLNSWNGPGSSNWGGHGAGPGSAKQNSGSRYYSSFNTAGRAVSQANAVAANVDGSFAQSDENDDHISRRVVVINSPKRPRIRSSSVSLTQQESLGVLKTLQLQGPSRFIHTAIETASRQSIPPLTQSRPRRNSTSSSDGLDRPSSPVRSFSAAAVESGSQNLPEIPVPVRPRRNSTSSTDGLERTTALNLTDVPVEPIEQVLRSRNSTSSQSESSIETRPTTPPQSPPLSSSRRTPTPPPTSSRFSYLVEARESGDVHRVSEAIAQFRASAKDATTADFNLALEALFETRAGESAMPMLETYNDMIKYSVHPDYRTYSLLISALAERDLEIDRALKLQSNNNRRSQLFGEWDGTSDGTLSNGQIEILSLEQRENFASMISLYAIAKSTVDTLPLTLHGLLLRSCLWHSNVDTAVQIFRHAEERFPRLHPEFYQFMIQIHRKVNDLSGAEKLFRRYVEAGRQGNLHVGNVPQKKHIAVWNAMIEVYLQCGHADRAIGLLDQMVNSPAGLQFSFKDIPLPASSTYSVIIKGFCDSGDIQSALKWYERLAEQGVEMSDQYSPSDQAIKPNAFASLDLLDALAERNLISEINKIYLTFDHTQPGLQRVPYALFHINMTALRQITDIHQAKGVLDFLSNGVFPHIDKTKFRVLFGAAMAEQYFRYGLFDDAIRFFCGIYEGAMAEINAEVQAPAASVELMPVIRQAFSRVEDAFSERAEPQIPVSFDAVLSFMHISRALTDSVTIPPLAQKTLLDVYSIAKMENRLPLERMTVRDWEILLMVALDSEGALRDLPDIPNYAFGGVFSFVEDMARYQVDVGGGIGGLLMERVVQHLVSLYGPHVVVGAFDNFGPAFQRVLDNSDGIRTLIRGPEPEPQPTPTVQFPANLSDARVEYDSWIISAQNTKWMDDALKQTNVRSQVLNAFSIFRKGVKFKKAPSPRILGRLIQGLGRQHEVEKAQEVYHVAQETYKCLAHDQAELRDAWICVEDSMIIALAHAGDIDNAHIHRLRLIEQGASPSADAYGALILSVKDTTDDASNALLLFNEALSSNIKMNIYLYNNIISKFAKARKADAALELFQRMKVDGVKPTSITYGALIGACARVGDVQSSETLFEEMCGHENFKARVPPFNTMMQLYTMTKPNRERALWFYEKMREVGVRPTAHTYKLLLDAYGSIEPVDIAAMEVVFGKLKKDKHVDVQGTHYASLINAYGCVQRDLEKAIAVFDSVPSSPPSSSASASASPTSSSASPTTSSVTPSSASSTTPSSTTSTNALDAIVFESIINVLVQHRRTDLIPSYITKMTDAGVHMTAYIANFLIKGYAIVGELDKAREVFEGLVDPPQGVAATGNHAPHEGNGERGVGTREFVYREPSTWEAMVRAELGAGYRDRASDLLQRLKSRQYPEAVYSRISGVMVDHSSLV